MPAYEVIHAEYVGKALDDENLEKVEVHKIAVLASLGFITGTSVTAYR